LVEGTDRIGQRGAKMRPRRTKKMIYDCIFKYLLKKRQHVMAITDRPPEMYERAITFRRPINDPGGPTVHLSRPHPTERLIRASTRVRKIG
jgi:hypothetical protein